MSRQRYNLFLVFLATIGLTVLYEWGPQGLYQYRHHGHALHAITIFLLVTLFLTHVFLATVMWMQRRKWDQAAASTFRFVCAKALFWAYAAFITPAQNGINLSRTFLLLVLLLTTIDLDIQLIRRYVFFRRDEATDARQGDKAGTAGNVRKAGNGSDWDEDGLRAKTKNPVA